MKQILKALFIGSLLLATPAQSAFVDQYVGNYEASEWPDGFKIYVGRESRALFTQTGDPTAYTFAAQARGDSSSTTALISGTVTTSADNGGSITITFSDADTTNLLNAGRRVYVTLDVLIGGEYFPVAAGYVPAEPIGSQLPEEVTPIEFEDMLSQLEAQVALAEAAATAAETAQAAAEAAAESATGIGDGDKGDITVSSSGSVWTVNSGAVDYSDVANTPTIPTNNNELTNGAGYITGYTVTEGDVTAHEAALSITKSQISDFSEGDYATAAQGALADSALQSGDNISVLTNDSGFITSYTVTEGDVTGVLSGATLTDAGTPASDDKVLIQDTSDSDNLKYVSFDEFGGGGVDWTATQTSTTADGASSNAFKLDTSSTYTLGDILSVSNNGTEVFRVDSNGYLYPNSNQFGAGSIRGQNGGLQIVGDEVVILGDSNGANRNNASLNKSELAFGSSDDAFIYPVQHNVGTAKSDLHINAAQASSADTNGDGADIHIGGGVGNGTGNNGSVMFSNMRNAAVSDGDLSASEGAWYVDESTNKLFFKYKHSDGSTVSVFEFNANP